MSLNVIVRAQDASDQINSGTDTSSFPSSSSTTTDPNAPSLAGTYKG